MGSKQILEKATQNKLLNKKMHKLSAKHDISEKEGWGNRLVRLHKYPPLLKAQ